MDESGRRFWSRSSPQVGRQQVLEETAVIGGGELAVAGDRPLVLLGTPDPPATGRDRLVLAHREPGTGLVVARDSRHDLARAHPREERETLLERPGSVEVEQQATQVLVDLDRGVGGRVEASGDSDLGLAHRDLVGERDRGLQTGAASLLDVVGRRGVVERAAEHALPGQVEVVAVLEHAAAGDLAQQPALEAEAARRARRAPP